MTTIIVMKDCNTNKSDDTVNNNSDDNCEQF